MTCRDCGKPRARYATYCADCAAAHKQTYQTATGQKTGCRECGGPRPAGASLCPECKVARAKARKKDKRKRERTAARRSKTGYLLTNHRKRARHYGVAYEPFDPRDAFDRDGWLCGVCHEPIDPALRYPDYRSVSLDHIIPLARGGGHTLNNSQPAHFICNSEKSDGVHV